jgi:hippurate hydrolase
MSDLATPPDWWPSASLCRKWAAFRHDLHAHPELKFAEHRTAARIAERLQALGLDVTCNVGGTGVVACLVAPGDTEGPSIGLRADMDALPIEETAPRAHRSCVAGAMHACGHDGHVAMLLGAAEILAALAAEGRLQGRIHFVFQPAEEGGAGARRMLDDGLLQRFPMQALFGLHNWPGLAAGRFRVQPGAVMAGTRSFDLKIAGRGGHAAMPHLASDTVLAGASLVVLLQRCVSRLTDPQAAAVLSVARFQAGSNNTALPEMALLGGTLRAHDAQVLEDMQGHLLRTCEAVARLHDVAIEPSFRTSYPPTVNATGPTALAESALRRAIGPHALDASHPPSMAADDFGYFCSQLPTCYAWLGSGPGAPLHSPEYDFNDEILPEGIAYWVSVAEQACASGTSPVGRASA